jgi:hypothetical protein
MKQPKAGDSVIITMADHFGALELYGATGKVVDGPGMFGDFGILLDPRHDPYQLPAAFKRHEFEVTGE